MQRLARAEEAASYGPGGGEPVGPELLAALRTARHGLLATAPPRVRLRARLWPASLVAAVRAGAAGWARRRPVLLGGRRTVRTV